MTVFFARQELFSFMMSHLSIVDYSAYANGVLLGKFFPVPMSSNLSTTFSSKRFSVSGLCQGLWSTWCWILGMVISWVYLNSSTYSRLVLPVMFIEDSIFCSVYISSFFLKIKDWCVKVGGLMICSSSTIHWLMGLISYQSHAVFITIVL